MLPSSLGVGKGEHLARTSPPGGGDDSHRRPVPRRASSTPLSHSPADLAEAAAELIRVPSVNPSYPGQSFDALVGGEGAANAVVEALYARPAATRIASRRSPVAATLSACSAGPAWVVRSSSTATSTSSRPGSRPPGPTATRSADVSPMGASTVGELRIRRRPSSLRRLRRGIGSGVIIDQHRAYPDQLPRRRPRRRDLRHPRQQGARPRQAHRRRPLDRPRRRPDRHGSGQARARSLQLRRPRRQRLAAASART